MKFTDSRVLKDFTSPFSVRLRKKNDRVSAAAEAIYQRWPDVVPNVTEENAQRRLERMADCLQRNSWQGTTLGDILVAARAAFDNRWIDNQDFNDFREFLIEELKNTDSAGLRRVLFTLYLSSFKAKSKHTRGLATSIKNCQESLNLKQQELIKTVPDILDPDNGPDLIAKKLLMEDSPIDTLANWGLIESYDDGLMSELHFAMVRNFKPILAKGKSNELIRFFAWLRPDSKSPRQRGAGKAIDVAMEPWLTSTPPADYRAELISGLVATYGDPRLKGGAAWHEASEESLLLLRHWLAGETMLIFLDAISSTLSKPSDLAMWGLRKKFWMGLYKEGLVDEAWVAFSREAYQAAQRKARNEHERNLYAGFGRQVAVGRKELSLLVMRFGGRIIVEGSHSYKVRLFEPTNASRPQLYEPAYDCIRIMRNADAEKAHNGNSWQTWVMQRVL